MHASFVIWYQELCKMLIWKLFIINLSIDHDELNTLSMRSILLFIIFQSFLLASSGAESLFNHILFALCWCVCCCIFVRNDLTFVRCMVRFITRMQNFSLRKTSVNKVPWTLCIHIYLHTVINGFASVYDSFREIFAGSFSFVCCCFFFF